MSDSSALQNSISCCCCYCIDEDQGDTIGRFSKVMDEIFCFKSSPKVTVLFAVQKYSDFWAILKNIPFQIKTALATFWAPFG